MLLNAAAIRLATTGFKAKMSAAEAKVTPLYGPFCELVTSSGYAETYLQPAGIGQLREWTGERQIGNIKVFSQTLTNRDWEKTVGIPRNAFLDDQLGMFSGRFVEMAVMAKLHPDKLFGELLVDGFTAEAWDGVSYFSDNHPLADGNVQSNLVSGALSASTFRAAVTKLRQMKSWENEPMDVFALGGQTTLVVGPALEDTARGILLAEYGASGASNTDHARAELKVFSRITGNQWFVGMSDSPLRPFVFQERQKPELIVKANADDDNVFHNKQVLFGVDGRWEMGYAFYHFMVGSTGA